MRKIFLLLAVFSFSVIYAVAGTVDHLVISEIQIDSIDAVDGASNRFIEIYNPTESAVDLTIADFRIEGWAADGTRLIIVHFNGSSEAEFRTVEIPARSFYLVVDANASDENLRMMADALVSQNFALEENYAVAIGFDAMSDGPTDFDTIDFVGFGESVFFEGSVAVENPSIGKSISRKFENDVMVDTDNNSADFEILDEPTPQNSTFVPPDPDPPADLPPDTITPITTANPAGGFFATTQSVELSINESATIFYSLSSEATKADFLEYSAPLEIGESKTLRFYSRDSADNEEEIKSEDFVIDFISPAFPENAELSAMVGDGFVGLNWLEAADENFDAYYLRINGGDFENIGNTLEFQKTGLTNGVEYFFEIFAVDFPDNESSLLAATATPNTPQIFMVAAMGEVVFNEVAWMGSTISSSDEWIELHNTTSDKIFDLSNWKILAADGKPEISLAGEIPPGEFLLLERTNDDSVLDIPADQIYTGNLSNSGEILTLLDSENSEIDCVDGLSSWEIGGDNDSKKTLVRISDGSYRTSFEADGTPRSANFRDHDLAMPKIFAIPENPLPGEEVVFVVEIENRGLNPADFEIVWKIDDDEISRETVQNLESFDFFEKTFSQIFNEGNFEITATIEFADDENFENNSTLLAFRIAPHLVISEFVPDPEGLDSENEWIELFNPTENLIDLVGFELNGVAIEGEIAGNAYRVFTAELSGWDALPNSVGEIILKKDGEVIDSKNYSGTIEKKSFGRDYANLSLWTEFWHPTCGSKNILPEINEPPVAEITIQGSGNSAGSCSLFVNLTAEDSVDLDSDDLIFEWDFGNGLTSDDENPDGFYFSSGNYTVTLVAIDVLGAMSEISRTFTISSCSGGGGGGSSTIEFSKKEETDEPVSDSVSASRVEMKITEVSFDSAADWIEIQMLDDGNSGGGIDVGGFYFEVDKRIKTIPKNTKMKTGEFLLLKFKSEEKDFTKSEEGMWKIFTDCNGLTKTDEQITLRDSSGTIEDAVVWENRNGAWSRGEAADIAEIVAADEWISTEFSDAVDSSLIKREIAIARCDSADTNSAADWFATPFATQGKENFPPPTSASEIELLISEVAPKNSDGDRVKLICRNCGSEAKNLAGFFLKFGENKIFEFPIEFEISSDDEIEIIFGAREESFSGNIFRSVFHGLTGTDGLLTLADFTGTTADFVGWSDRSAPPNREHDLASAELTRLEKQFADGQWDSKLPESLINSCELSRGGSILRKKSADTNSAIDFEIFASSELFPETEKMAGRIRISEILPNPRGSDSGKEWFELENVGEIPVELFGWQVFAGSGSYEFEESVILAPNELRAFFGLLPIRNSGSIFTLFDVDGEIVDSIEYPEIREGVSFAKNSNGEFLKTEIFTPNAVNGFYQILPASEDADADGFSDLAEMEFGTDFEKFDTDGDGLPDYFEVQHGFDPNSSESSPENLRGYRVELAALAGSRFEYSVDKGNGISLSGTGVPGGRMRIYIHSELSIVEIPIAENGSWSYMLDRPLEAGHHNIFTQLIDPAGVEGVARKVLNFDLVEKFTPPVFAESICISEILPNPVGSDAENEFIELENFGNKLADLSNFHLVVGRKKFTFPENSTIPAGGFLVLARAKSGLTLPNSGGVISLAWPTGRTVAELSYEKIREGVALAFDGSEFRETVIFTPASANKIFISEIYSSKTKKVQKNRNGNLSDAIQISEILANPIEKDSVNEWIEIWNSGPTTVNLGNWRIDDSVDGSNPFVISDLTILQPGEFRTFPRTLTKIAFNNSGREAARLFDFEGRLIAEVNFDSPLEGIALAFDGSEFRETAILTPDFTNQFDSQKIEGVIRFVGKEGFVIENSNGEFFVEFEKGNSALLAKALLQKGEEWKIFVENSDGNFMLKNFAATPKLLRSQLLSPTNSLPLESQNSAWIFTFLVFMMVFFLLRFAKLGEVWDSQN